ncbi:MAG: IPT/TIG domain-containing protein [Prevotella sp.]|jgi:sugar lactone lactonase YvrE|nr:IPT/TIG domain-containing protein [Prevotella sp.]
MKTKSITKKSERWRYLWIMLALVVFGFASCGDDTVEIPSSAVVSDPFDPSKPVVISEFLPTAGGMGQRLMIYGSNFGNDASIVQVFIGGKKAVIISVQNESIYCIVPRQAFGGDIEVRVGADSPVVGHADEIFDYQRKMVVSTLAGYKNDRDDQGWKDGSFKKNTPNSERASGFDEGSWLKFDPLSRKHMYMVFDNRSGLYHVNFEDSTISRVSREDFSRPRGIDFSTDAQYMLVAEDRGGESDRNVIALPRSSDFKSTEVLTRFKQCNTVAVHPENGEMYYNSYNKGQFYRYDLMKWITEGSATQNTTPLFFVHDPEWEYRIQIHPTGNYCYIVVVNRHYILRCDYNWSKKLFNQPYIVAGGLKASGWADGVGTSARFDTPYQGVFVKNSEYEGQADEYDFYIADRFTHSIRVLSPDGAVTTFAGRGSSSINADPWGYVDGDLREEARFDRPTGIEYDEVEKAFYVGDGSNKRIRKIALEEMDEEAAPVEESEE